MKTKKEAIEVGKATIKELNLKGFSARVYSIKQPWEENKQWFFTLWLGQSINGLKMEVYRDDFNKIKRIRFFWFQKQIGEMEYTPITAFTVDRRIRSILNKMQDKLHLQGYMIELSRNYLDNGIF